MQIENADNPGSPSALSSNQYYLVPYNMHLTNEMSSQVPLHIVDQNGNAGSENVEFATNNPPTDPMGADARTSLDWICYTSNEPDFLQARENWLDDGAVFDNLNPDVVDGI